MHKLINPTAYLKEIILKIYFIGSKFEFFLIEIHFNSQSDTKTLENCNIEFLGSFIFYYVN